MKSVFMEYSDINTMAELIPPSIQYVLCLYFEKEKEHTLYRI